MDSHTAHATAIDNADHEPTPNGGSEVTPALSLGRVARHAIRAACEREQVPIAGDEDRLFLLGEREEVVVVWIGGTGSDPRRVGCEQGGVSQEFDEVARVARRDSVAEFGIGERKFELLEQALRHDKFERAGKPGREEPCWRAISGQQ
jgi:hypothetical protein